MGYQVKSQPKLHVRPIRTMVVESFITERDELVPARYKLGMSKVAPDILDRITYGAIDLIYAEISATL